MGMKASLTEVAEVLLPCLRSAEQETTSYGAQHMIDNQRSENRQPSKSDSGRMVWIAIAMIGAASVVAALLRAPLTWDGAYYFYRILQIEDNMFAHDRKAGLLIHYPAVWVLRTTENVDLALFAFNLAHVLTPLLALLLCWI